MKTMNCPRCGAYTQGNFKPLDTLPHHLTAPADDMELVPCEPGTPGQCEASGYLLPTVDSDPFRESRHSELAAVIKAAEVGP